MTCRYNDRCAIVVSDTATLLQMLLLSNVDDISISRIVVIVKCMMHVHYAVLRSIYVWRRERPLF
jgi:hypothetical protein